MALSKLSDRPCSVARTLSVIGERWTLVILRECFSRVRRFEDFLARTGASRRILTERLNSLVEHGLLVKVPYQQRPLRHEYRLTRKGLDIYPILIALMHWGDTYCADASGPPLLLRHRRCGEDFHPVMVCSQCGEPVEAHQTEARPGPGQAASTGESNG